MSSSLLLNSNMYMGCFSNVPSHSTTVITVVIHLKRFQHVVHRLHSIGFNSTLFRAGIKTESIHGRTSRKVFTKQELLKRHLRWLCHFRPPGPSIPK